MNYTVFCKEKGKLKLLDILIIILWIASIIIIWIPSVFKTIVIINIILLFIKMYLETKENIKNINKICIDKPIVMNDENIYILQDKSGNVMLILGFVSLLMFFMFKLNGNMLDSFVMLVIVLVFEGSYLLKLSNIKYLKNNINNLYNILNNTNTKYNINKIEKITKTDNDNYIIEFTNHTTKEVLFTEKYENYNDLINRLNKKCSERNEIYE